MRQGVLVVVGAVLVSALVGCTGGGEEPVGLSTVTASPSPEVEATPTPTPTPSSILGRVLDMSDPELGIVFDGVPDLTGDEADVYNWIATYRQEYWRTMTTNEVSPAFSVFTSADVLARMEEIVATNTADQSQVGGVFQVRISDIVVEGDTARGTSCDDYRQVTVVEPGGPLTLEEAQMAEPRLMEITLARSPAGQGLWTIQTSAKVATC